MRVLFADFGPSLIPDDIHIEDAVLLTAPDRTHPRGHISPREIITHRIPLEDVADAYDLFVNKRDHCIKPVLIPPSARDAA